MNIASSFKVISTVLWFGSFAFLFFAMYRASKQQPVKKSGPIIITTFLVSLIFSLISMGMVFIEPHERGIVISAVSPQGYREQALQPGLQWILPGLETVQRYPISKQSYTMSIASDENTGVGDNSITARTSDGQQIFVDASVIYSINPASVIKVHIEWQNRYSEGLVRPVARAVIRDAVSQFGVEEVYSSKRDELTLMISEGMTEKLAENGLILDQFLLRNITFSDEYAASVEQKQIAEQQAQQAKFVVEQKKQEAEQARQIAQGLADAAVIKAKAEAEARLIEAEAEKKALILIAEAVKDRPDLLTYQYITHLAPNIQTMLLPADSPFLFPLPEMNSDSLFTVPDSDSDTNPSP